MRLRTLSTSILVISAFCGAARAEEAAQPDQGQPSAPTRTSELSDLLIDRSVANGPTDRLLGSSTVPQLQFLASSDEKTASLTWSLNFSRPRTNNLSHTQLTMGVETTIDDAESDTELFGLTGFPGGTEVTLNLTHFFGGIRRPEGEALAQNEAIIARAISNCERNRDLTTAARAVACNLDHPDNPGVSRTVELYNLEGLSDFIAARFAPVFPFLGVEFTGNQDSYSYLDRTAFRIDRISRFGYNATLFGGVLFTGSPTSITGSFTYSRRYEAQSSVTLCQTISATQEQCLTGADGRPESARRAVVALELRHAWGSREGSLPRFAIAPELSTDLRDNSYAIDVPIYLAQDGSGRLKGGIRFGYVNRRSDDGDREGEFSFGLFVGAPFTVLN